MLGLFISRQKCRFQISISRWPAQARETFIFHIFMSEVSCWIGGSEVSECCMLSEKILDNLSWKLTRSLVWVKGVPCSFQNSGDPLHALFQGESHLVVVLPAEFDLVKVVLGRLGVGRGDSGKEVAILVEENDLQDALIRDEFGKGRPLRLGYAPS